MIVEDTKNNSSNKDNNDDDLTDTILSTLRGSSNGRSMEIKELRKLILLSRQLDPKDKSAKKLFKKSIQYLESQTKLSLNSDGIVTLSKVESKKKKKKKKRKRKDDDGDDDDDEDTERKKPKEEEEEGTPSSSPTQTKHPLNNNPQNITRLFLGNLPFSIDDTSLQTFFHPATITHIKWITDKETGRFYGSAFIEMETPQDAASVMTKNGDALLNRPIKINYAPAKPGQIWPPPTKVVTGGGGKSRIADGLKPMSEKPSQCKKLFIGNLSYEIDDDGIYKFFGSVDAEVKAVRWLHHRESGDFKGCGFVEFWDEAACDKAAMLNGKSLLGRPIRIDWSD